MHVYTVPNLYLHTVPATNLNFLMFERLWLVINTLYEKALFEFQCNFSIMNTIDILFSSSNEEISSRGKI